MKKGVKTLIADASYKDKKRTATFAETQVILITPDVCSQQVAAMSLPMDAMAMAIFNETQGTRKTAIEPVFD